MLLKEIVYVHTYKYGDALQNIESLKLKFGYSCSRSRIIVKAARILRRIHILSLSCLVLKSSVCWWLIQQFNKSAKRTSNKSSGIIRHTKYLPNHTEIGHLFFLALAKDTLEEINYRFWNKTRFIKIVPIRETVWSLSLGAQTTVCRKVIIKMADHRVLKVLEVFIDSRCSLTNRS